MLKCISFPMIICVISNAINCSAVDASVFLPLSLIPFTVFPFLCACLCTMFCLSLSILHSYKYILNSSVSLNLFLARN
uniref:Uncharacterized protein n=1 Tax=Anguilla anguilla TaxID=7936 RepID=A0A0E9QRA8_ANGAN